MARNRKGGGSRIGAIRNRTQFMLPDGHWAKRDSRTGEILSIKADKNPYKSITKEEQPATMAEHKHHPSYPPLKAWDWSVPRSRRPATTPEPLQFPQIEIPEAA